MKYPSVSLLEITNLYICAVFRKFLKSGLIEDVRGSTTRPDDFKDNRELYRYVILNSKG